MKRIAVLALLVLVFVITTGCATVLEKYNSAVDPNSTETILVTVPSGATTTSIANLLIDNGLIQNANAFKAKSKQLDVDGQMKAGDYNLSKALTTEEIITMLVDGDVYIETTTFTIPEGYEVRQIVDTLESEGLIDRAKFLDALQNAPYSV